MYLKILTIVNLICVYKMATAYRRHAQQQEWVDTDDDSCKQSICKDRRCQAITILSNSGEVVGTPVVDPSVTGVKLASITMTAQHGQSGSCDARYRSNDTHLIVDDGCQAEFQVCLYRTACQRMHPGKAPAEVCHIYDITSEHKMELLPVGTGFGRVTSMMLLRQKSTVPCEHHKTFGFYKWTAFTRKGCSGRFKICHESTTDEPRLDESSTPSLPSDVENPDWTCVDVKLLSRIHRPVDKTITDEEGKEVTIQSMTLVHQHSDISCEQGETYSSKGSLARAWGGCRGTFKICYGSQSEEMATTYKPESTDLKCVDVNLFSRIIRPVDKTITDGEGKEVTIQSMTLVHQHSDISCEQGETYSSTGSVARAWGGCRGTFKICYGLATEESVLETIPATPDLRCVDVNLFSRINRPVDKTIQDEEGKEVTIQSMTLVHQHSDIGCEQGETYSSTGSLARAWGGCRGTFKICYSYGSATEEETVEVLPASPDLKCVDVKLMSGLNRPVERTITDDEGKEVTIQSMTLVHQQSDIYCGREESYSSSGSVAKAWGGCRGVFRVCYAC